MNEMTTASLQNEANAQAAQTAGRAPQNRPRNRRGSEWQRNKYKDKTTTQLSTSLGWLSIGLGAVEALAPRKLSGLIGVPEQPLLLRALGAREIASGLAILAQPHRPAPVWSRVIGDAIDLALLGTALRSANGNRNTILVTAAAVGGITALDVICSRQLATRTRSGQQSDESGALRVQKSIAISRPPEDCYTLWRSFANLPRFMKHLESVREIDSKRQHWVAKAPLGGTVEWDAEITEEKQNEVLGWRSLRGSDVQHSGTVRFMPYRGRGTVLTVDMHYSPPGGMAGALTARLFGEEPEVQLQDDLRRFKQIVETGELATIEGQPHGERGMFYGLISKGKR